MDGQGEESRFYVRGNVAGTGHGRVHPVHPHAAEQGLPCADERAQVQHPDLGSEIGWEGAGRGGISRHLDVVSLCCHS